MELATGFVGYTYVDPKLLDRTTITADHIAFYRDNCRKLADFMAALPREDHVQCRYGIGEVVESKKRLYECGTPQCALGWAAFSNIIDGLQFGVGMPKAESDNGRAVVAPVVNGGAADWDNVGKYFFGESVKTRIFDSPNPSRDEIVDMLRDAAEQYDAMLNPKEFDDNDVDI